MSMRNDRFLEIRALEIIQTFKAIKEQVFRGSDGSRGHNVKF